jgi:hypothetical protein
MTKFVEVNKQPISLTYSNMCISSSKFLLARLFSYQIVHNSKFLARFGMGRSFAKNLNLCVQTEKKE